MSNITKFQINVGGKELSFDTEPIYQSLDEKSDVGHSHPLDELEDGVLDTGEAVVKGIVFKTDGSYAYNGTTFDNTSYRFVNLGDETDARIQISAFATKFDAIGDFSNVTRMNGMFYGCSNLTTLDVSNWDTSNVTEMGAMFNNCYSLTSLDLSNFDTSKVTSMTFMFDGCSKLRYITLGENFFKTTQTVPFDGATNLGFNEDSTDNGWLEHLATTAPQITDGQARTIQLHNNLKNKSWASTHIATLQSKGYTIA